MAPELRAKQPSTPMSDQYSFCVGLREALTTDRARRAGVPARLLSVLTRGLDEDPLRRWPTMDALGDALEGVLLATPEQRHRHLVLDRVDELWLRGNLSECLRGREPMALKLSMVAPSK